MRRFAVLMVAVLMMVFFVLTVTAGAVNRFQVADMFMESLQEGNILLAAGLMLPPRDNVDSGRYAFLQRYAVCSSKCVAQLFSGTRIVSRHGCKHTKYKYLIPRTVRAVGCGDYGFRTHSHNKLFGHKVYFKVTVCGGRIPWVASLAISVKHPEERKAVMLVNDCVQRCVEKLLR